MQKRLEQIGNKLGELIIEKYGTSEGAMAAWDTRGRGRKAPEKKEPKTPKAESAKPSSRPSEWPMYADEDQESSAVTNALEEGANIESVEVMDQWEDDHQPAVGVKIKLDDGSIHYASDWWLSKEGLRLYHHAEAGKKSSLKELKTHILLALED